MSCNALAFAKNLSVAVILVKTGIQSFQDLWVAPASCTSYQARGRQSQDFRVWHAESLVFMDVITFSRDVVNQGRIVLNACWIHSTNPGASQAKGEFFLLFSLKASYHYTYRILIGHPMIGREK